MNRKMQLIAMTMILALSTLACGITLTMPEAAIEIGDLRTEEILISGPSSDTTADVLLEFGAGKLIINPGSTDGIISGTATYNVDGVEPQVTTTGSKVTLKQDPFDFELGGLPNVNQVKNEWDLAFGSQPMELDIRAGAFEGEIELGGLNLEKVDIFSGAASTKVNFDTPNATTMSEFTFTTGASDCKLTNLGNANFSLMTFRGGAGNYTLDFSGGLSRDATVEIDAALSNVHIIVPAGTYTTLNIDGILANVNIHGDWAGGASTYSLAGDGPLLTIRVNLGAGNLELSN